MGSNGGTAVVVTGMVLRQQGSPNCTVGANVNCGTRAPASNRPPCCCGLSEAGTCCHRCKRLSCTMLWRQGFPDSTSEAGAICWAIGDIRAPASKQPPCCCVLPAG